MGVEIPLGEAQISIEWLCAGVTRPMVSTFGINPPAGVTTLSAMLLDVNTELVDSTLLVASQISNQYTCTGIIGQLQTTAGILSQTRPVNLTGTASFQPPPPNVSWVIQKRTGLGGRPNRGRMYFPPARLGETVVNAAGVVDSANVSAEQADWDAFLSGMQGLGYEIVLFHSDGSPSTEITSFVVESLVATQRRRLR